MKKLLIFCLLILSLQPLFATSIVILITSKYIVIGADSKRMIIDAENNYAYNETVCKIRTANNYCYAVAGLVASAGTSFSSDSIINKHLQKTRSINKAAKQIEKEITTALKTELAYQKKHQPKQFQKTLESKDHLLEVVLLRIINNIPQVYIIGFTLEDADALHIKTYTETCATNCATAGPKLFFLGEYSCMEKYLNAPHEEADPVSLVNQLILSQSKITPRSVGAPVSLAKLHASGVEWINRQCN